MIPWWAYLIAGVAFYGLFVLLVWSLAEMAKQADEERGER